MVQHRDGADPDVGRRQPHPRAPLVLDPGDLLWKCWVTNVHRGVQVQVLSAKRASGLFSAAIIFVREDEKKGPVARFWVKHELREENVIEVANDIMRSVADDRLHFRMMDLSELKTTEEQVVRLRDEGFEIMPLYRTVRRPGEN